MSETNPQYYSSSNLNQDLYLATQSEDYEAISSLIERNASVNNIIQSTNHTILFECAHQQQWEMVRYLIDTHRADINPSKCDHDHDECRYSLLHHAIVDPMTTIELIDYLIDVGVDVEGGIEDQNYLIPLVFAAKYQKIEIVKHFITKYQIRYSDDDIKRMLLISAIQSNDLDFVQYIVDNFDINIQKLCQNIDQNQNETISQPLLSIAVRQSSIEVVKYLVQNKATIIYDDITTNGDNIFLRSILNDDTTIFQYLLQEINVNDEIKSNIINHCLIETIRYPSLCFRNTRFLLDNYKNNIDRNFKDSHGFSILHQLVSICMPSDSLLQFIKYFKPTKQELEEIAPYNIQDLQRFNNITPLFHAATIHNYIGDDINKLKLLISLGANINCVDDQNSTLLHAYCSRSSTDSDDGFRTKLQYFIKNLHLKIESKDNNGQTPLHFASQYGSENMIEAVIKCKANINVVDNNGNTPLLFVLANQNFNTVETTRIFNFMIQSKANIHCKTNNGNNAFDIAVKFHDDVIFELLLNNHINVDDIDSNGNTPFLNACATSSRRNIHWFIKHGANIHHCNKSNQNALHYAIQHSNLNLIEYLCESGVDVNVQDIYGNTPLDLILSLECTSEYQRLWSLVVLCENGANP